MKVVELHTSNGTRQAELFEPSGASQARLPGLIVVHEWWGLNDSMRGVCRRFAAEGFVVLATDLYGGFKTTTDANEARQLAMEMKTMESMAIIEAGARHLKDQPGCNGRVGVTGFCLGGAMTLAAACHCPSASAFVPFYGMPLAKHVDWSKTLGPIQGHYAEHDYVVDIKAVRAAAESVSEHGGSFELHVYDANHAFMRETDPKVYNPQAAAVAWPRALQFLRKSLS